MMRLRRNFSTLLLLGVLSLAQIGGSFPAQAQWFDWLFKPRPEPQAPTKTLPPRPRPTPPAQPRSNQPAKPFIQTLKPEQERALLQISETFGSLAFLTALCPHDSSQNLWQNPWLERMEALITSDGDAFGLRNKMAGAYNQGYLAFATSYRQCTGMAEVARRVLLRDVAQQAQGIEQML